MKEELPIYSKELFVTDEHIDQNGHVNNVIYVQWVNDIALEHWFSKSNQKQQKEVLWFLVKHTINYKSQAVIGDRIIIKTQVGRATNVRYERLVNIYNADSSQLLASSKTDWCAVNPDGKIIKISQEIRDLFEVK
ncbi:acyl-CoA thioesterase [Nonlabens sp. SY33080]|uniref:acyl-CoA thioesterase n=1 Tax=Nonlabens sp. SY33080 TaxID=2719911 RepID=UPI001F0EFBDA|nr:thioesterase family protein [Nonlabens sp. SY33080]